MKKTRCARKFARPLPGILVLLLLSAFAGCKSETGLANDGLTGTRRQRIQAGDEGAPDEFSGTSILDRRYDSIRSPEPFILIGEEDFLRALSQDTHSPAPAKDRAYATTLVGQASDAAAEGFYGQISDSTKFSGSLFVVARRSAFAEDPQFVEATDFYVAAVFLEGESRWHAVGPDLIVSEGFPRAQCSRMAYGCAPLFEDSAAKPQSFTAYKDDAMGLPWWLRIQAERPIRADDEVETDSDSRVIEFQVHSRPGVSANKFGCRAPVRIDACPGASEDRSAFEQVKFHTSLSEEVLLVREEDFLSALQEGRGTQPEEHNRAYAYEVATMANSASSIGVMANSRHGDFEAEVFIVARGASIDLDRGTFEASSFYVSPIRMTIHDVTVGVGVAIGSTDELPEMGSGACGALSIQREVPEAPLGFPPYETFTFESETISTATTIQEKRWAQNRSATSVSTFDYERPLFGRATTLCIPGYELESSLPPPGGEPYPCEHINCFETCDGLDNNENGLIDEVARPVFVQTTHCGVMVERCEVYGATVCGDRRLNCPCEPSTCVQPGTGCGLVPDGCGATMSCSACN